MRRFDFSVNSSADFASALEYLEARSPREARRLELEVVDALQRLADTPGMGHFREDLAAKPARFWVVRGYVIAYWPISEGIQVIAILHGARDIAGILNERDVV